MKSSFLLLALMFLFTSLTYSQGIRFDDMLHDYGNISEDGGKVEARFTFTNISDKPVTIVSVRPSCGCTASDWTRNAVEPGGKGYVTSVFDPLNRPGYFNKSITVITDAAINSPINIYIKGNVTPKTRHISMQYPFTMGALKFKTNHLAFGQIKTKEVKTDSFAVYNDGASPVSIRFPELPAFIKAVSKPIILDPGNEGFIIISYDGGKRDDWGIVFDRFSLYTNDQQQPQKVLNVSANIVEDFSDLSNKALSRAPRLVFSSTNYDFGTINEGNILEFEFEFRNTGKSLLTIKRVKASCGCTVATPEKTLLKRNQKSSLRITFNSTGRPGRQHFTVNVISNDPTAPDQVLTINGIVE